MAHDQHQRDRDDQNLKERSQNDPLMNRPVNPDSLEVNPDSLEVSPANQDSLEVSPANLEVNLVISTVHDQHQRDQDDPSLRERSQNDPLMNRPVSQDNPEAGLNHDPKDPRAPENPDPAQPSHRLKTLNPNPLITSSSEKPNLSFQSILYFFLLFLKSNVD